MRHIEIGYVFVIAAMLASTRARADDWPQLQHDPAHTGYTADQPNPPYRLLWRRDLKEPISTAHQAVVAAGMVFVGTNHGNLYALDRKNGEPVWIYKTGAPILGSPAYDDGVVYVNSMDHLCHAVDAKSGKRLWTFETGEGIWAAPVAAEGRVFVAARDGFVYAVGAKDGKEQWRFKIGSPVLATPAYGSGRLYVPGGDMHVFALDGKTGQRVWQSPKIPGAAMREYWLIAAGDTVIATSQLAFTGHGTQEQIMRGVMTPFNERHAKDPVLVEDEVFPELVKWYETHPHHKTFHVLDAETGRVKFIAPIIGVNGGSCITPPPAVSPDGWAYTVYANIWLRASGWAFFGRLRLKDGKFEPLITDRYAPKLAFPDQWHAQPKAGSQFGNRSVFDGGFNVSDQSWGQCLGGDRAFLVRDPGWVQDTPSYNTMLIPTRRDEYMFPNISEARRLLSGGTFGGAFHSTCAPPAVSDNQVFHKAVRSVIFAFEGTDRKE